MERSFVLKTSCIRQRAFGPLSVVLCCLMQPSTSHASGLDGLTWRIEQSVGIVDSQWREKTNTGVVHVKESGSLGAVVTAFSMSHPWFHASVRYEQLLGDRLYEGVTNQGVRATSTTNVKNGMLGLTLLAPVNSNWALGVATDRISMHRDIRSTPTAVGYPEHYKYTFGKVGVQHRLALMPDLQLETSVWLGKSFDDSLLLRLPGYDAAHMSLGHGRTTEVGWRLVKSFADSKWQASLKFGYRKERFKAGEATTLFKAGRIAGSAQQPAWQHGAAHLVAELSYGF